jgi:hypothetical protein
VEDSEKKIIAEKIDRSKVDTYKKRKIFSTHVRFSILQLNNLELLKKGQYAVNKKTKNN